MAKRLRKQIKAEWRDAGMCLECGSQAAKGRLHCSACLYVSAEKARLRAQRLREAGLCQHCGCRPLAEGRLGCKECLESKAKRSRQRRGDTAAEGQCRCGSPLDSANRKTCATCRAYFRERCAAHRARRRERGLCIRCAAPHKGQTLICEECAAVARLRRRQPVTRPDE